MTRDEWVEDLRRRASEAETVGSLAPIATLLAAVAEEAVRVDGWPAAKPPADVLTPLDQAAKRLSVTVRWLRETRPPYVVELGDKTLRVSELKLARFLAAAGGQGRN